MRGGAQTGDGGIAHGCPFRGIERSEVDFGGGGLGEGGVDADVDACGGVRQEEEFANYRVGGDVDVEVVAVGRADGGQSRKEDGKEQHRPSHKVEGGRCGEATRRRGGG